MGNTEKIKILRVVTWLPVGGVEKRLVKILPLLNEAPFEFRVLCLREKGALAPELEKSGIKVDLIPFKSRLDPFALKKFVKYLKEEKFHLIHSHMYRSNVPATIAGRIAGVPVIVSQIHNVDTWQTFRQVWMDRFLCRYRAGLIAVSEEVKRDVVKVLRVPEEFCRVIYNGVSVENFENVKRDRRVFGEAGIGENDVVVVMVSRLVEQKNPDIALKAFSEIVKKRPDAHLVFAGGGNMKNQLKALVEEKGLGGNIHFLGTRPDIAEILAASDIFTLPSSKEGFSNAILEAMASGLPVVVSDVGGNGEAVVDGESGFILPPGDAGVLKDKLLFLIENGERRLAMGRAANLRAKEFSLDNMRNSVRQYYLSLLKNKGITA